VPVDVLLAHSNRIAADPKQVRKMQPYPPLQTLIAAACLREAGYSVAVFDAAFCSGVEEFEEELEQARPRAVAIVEDNFNFLTKMCLTAQRDLACAMLGAAARRSTPAVVNGSDASDRPELYLEAGAQAVALGEVELTLPPAVGALARRTPLSDIAGLAYRNGSLRKTAPRRRIEDLDRLPAAAWDLIDLAPYRDRWREAHGRFSVSLISSRGCPYHCNWCAKPLFGQQYAVRSAEALAAEMAHVKQRHGAEHIWFADDIFALSNRWTMDFADAVEKLDARLPFKMQSRCDLMTRETVGALARAGCEEVWMGAESGSQKILDAMDKQTRVEQILEARANLRNHGIRAGFFLQFGYPGEEWEDIQQTLELLREAEPDDVGVSVSYPLPGTRFHDLVADQLGPKRNWTHSDDLAMMFPGVYSSDFYRRLRDLVHLEVDLINGRAEPAADQHLRAGWEELAAAEPSCRNPHPVRPWTSC